MPPNAQEESFSANRTDAGATDSDVKKDVESSKDTKTARQRIEQLKEELRVAQMMLREAKLEETRADMSSKQTARSIMSEPANEANDSRAAEVPTPSVCMGSKAASRQRHAPSVFSPSLFVKPAAEPSERCDGEEKRVRSAAELHLLAERVRINSLGCVCATYQPCPYVLWHAMQFRAWTGRAALQ